MAKILHWRVGDTHMKHKKKSHAIKEHASCNKTYIGYCHSNRHKGYITQEILKQHNCLNQKYIDKDGKEQYRVCPRLEKFEDRPFWTRKKRAKMMRALHKEAAALNISANKVDEAAKRYAYNENLIRVMLGLRV